MEGYNQDSLLSVIVPISRMHGKMKNLFSWLNQVDDHECEVIIIHDKQDQKTSEELQKRLENLNSSKVQLLEGNFGSPGLARNFGKQHASGTHIMFCDSDDVLQLSSAIKVIRQNPIPKIIIGGYEAINSQSNHKIVKHQEPASLVQLAKSPGIWRFIFKIEAIVNLEFTEYCMGEDQLFLAQLSMFSQDVLCVSETLYHYYTNTSGQLTSQKDRIPELISVIGRLKKLEKQFHGQSRTLVKLLILKNCLTVLKNAPKLAMDSKRRVLIKLTKQIVVMILTLNWNHVFRFGGKSD